MLVHQPRADAGELGDILDCGAVEPLRQNSSICRGHDLAAALLSERILDDARNADIGSAGLPRHLQS
jgi:hypothetical protein